MNDHAARNEAIRALRRKGVPLREIAPQFGISMSGISKFAYGIGPKRGRKARARFEMRLDHQEAISISTEAERRGMTREALAKLVICTIARDGLWLAILDDEGATP